MTSVLGMSSNLECLLPFVEQAGKNIMNISFFFLRVCLFFVCLCTLNWAYVAVFTILCVSWCVCLFICAVILTFYHAYMFIDKLSSDSKDSKSKKSVSSRYASVLILLTIQGTEFLKHINASL